MTSEAILRAMIAMGSADRDFSSCERAEVCAIYQHTTGETLDEAAIDAMTATCDMGPAATIAYLRGRASTLTRADKEQLISAAYRVLLSDGVITCGERKTLSEIAQAIGMPEIHYKAILEDVAG